MDTYLEVITSNRSFCLEPLTIKKGFFQEEDVFMNPESRKNVTTKKKKGTKYKKISDCEGVSVELNSCFSKAIKEAIYPTFDPCPNKNIGTIEYSITWVLRGNIPIVSPP